MPTNIYKNQLVQNWGFTIIEAIISMALFSVLSIFIFSVGIPLKLHTDQVKQKLVYYEQIQFVTLYIHQLTKSSERYEIVSGDSNGVRALENLGLGSFSGTSMQVLMNPSQTYILFELQNGLVLCGIFTNTPNTLMCIFSYPERVSEHVLLSIDQAPFLTPFSKSENQSLYNLFHRIDNHLYSQIKIYLPGYHIFVGFLPHIKQVIQ